MASRTNWKARLRKIGSWSFLIAFGLIALMEWQSRRHYRSTLDALGKALAQDMTRTRTVPILRQPEAKALVTGWPWPPAGEVSKHNDGSIVGYRWPSLLHKYRLSLLVTSHDRIINLHIGSPEDLRQSLVPPTVPVAASTAPTPALVVAGPLTPLFIAPSDDAVVGRPANQFPDVSVTVKKAFAAAHQMVEQERTQTEEFRTALRAIAPGLPKLQLTAEDAEQALWSHVQVFMEKVPFTAVKLSHNLPEPGYLLWMVCSRESTLHCELLPVNGDLPGIPIEHVVAEPRFRGWQTYEYGNLGALPAVPIQAGQEYILWCSRRPFPLESKQKIRELDDERQLGPAFARPTKYVSHFNYENRVPEPGTPFSITARVIRDDMGSGPPSAWEIAERLGAAFREAYGSRILIRNQRPIFSANLTGDGKTMAYSDGTSTAHVITLGAESDGQEFEGDVSCQQLSIAPDGRRLAGAGQSGTQFSIWEIPEGMNSQPLVPAWSESASKELAGWKGDSLFNMTAPHFLADSDVLFIPMFGWNYAKKTSVLDVSLWKLSEQRLLRQHSFRSNVYHAAASSDEELIVLGHDLSRSKPAATASTGGLEIGVLDWATGAVKRKVELGDGRSFGTLSVSADSRFAGIAFGMGDYLVVDLQAGAIAGVIPAHAAGQYLLTRDLSAVAWSPDSRLLALGFSDRSIRVWRLPDCRLHTVWKGHIDTVTSLAFLPDGRSLISASLDGTIRSWPAMSPAADDLADSADISLAWIPAGEYVMGTGWENADPYGNLRHERPPHRVRITKPFYLGRHEVTVGQFRAFVEATGYKTQAEADGSGGRFLTESGGTFVQKPELTWRSPGFEQTDEHPVVQVSWNDAQAFCQWLSDREQAPYRLPTEAEWEYAARAGDERIMWNGNSAGQSRQQQHYGNVADQSLEREVVNYPEVENYDDGFPWTAPAGKFMSNAFGLYDMHGNVFEWCADWYRDLYYYASPTDDPQGPPTGTHRVERGGAYSHRPHCSRSCYREKDIPTEAWGNVGFRVLREIPVLSNE